MNKSGKTANEVVDELVQQTVDRFITLLEESKGKGKWIKPFFSTSGMHRNMYAKKGITYEGFNMLLLEMVAQQRGFTSNLWATKKQLDEHNKIVKDEEFEKSTPVILWNFTDKKDKDGNIVYVTDENGNKKTDVDGNPIPEKVCFKKYYRVYNECQLEGYVEKQPEKIDENILNKINVFKEQYLDRIGANYTEGHGHACYCPMTDSIELPSISQYNRDMLFEYIPTACHETVHWSGAKSRLNRDLSGHFGDNKYAYEELIADIGAGFISQEFGQPYLFSNNNLKYIEGWIKELKDKPQTLVSACSKAKQAYKYLMTLASED